MVGHGLVEARGGPKAGLLSTASWRGIRGTRQSRQTLALCNQQRALVLSGKLKQKKTCQNEAEVLRGGPLITAEMLIGAPS